MRGFARLVLLMRSAKCAHAHLELRCEILANEKLLRASVSNLVEILGLLELLLFAVVVQDPTTYYVEIGFILIVVIVMIVITSLVSSPSGSGPGGRRDGRSAYVAMTRIVRVTSS